MSTINLLHPTTPTNRLCCCPIDAEVAVMFARISSKNANNQQRSDQQHTQITVYCSPPPHSLRIVQRRFPHRRRRNLAVAWPNPVVVLGINIYRCKNCIYDDNRVWWLICGAWQKRKDEDVEVRVNGLTLSWRLKVVERGRNSRPWLRCAKGAIPWCLVQ